MNKVFLNFTGNFEKMIRILSCLLLLFLISGCEKTITFKLEETPSSLVVDANIENGIQALRDMPMNEGYIAACETA